MTKKDFRNLLIKNRHQTCFELLREVFEKHFNNGELEKGLIMLNCEYNKFLSNEIKGINEEPVIRSINNRMLGIIEKLDERDYPVNLKSTEKELIKHKRKKSSSNRNLIIFTVVGFIIGILLGYFTSRKSYKNQETTIITKLEESFNSMLKNSSFPSSSNELTNTMAIEMIGEWSVDIEAVGVNNGTLRNVLNRKIGGNQLLFYPIKSTMKIWDVSYDTTKQISHLKGIEFVKIAILKIPKDSIARKYSNKEIEEYSVANVGSIFLSEFMISPNSRNRTFFNIAHFREFNSKIFKDQDAQDDIIKFLNEIADYEERTCNNIKDIIETSRGKILEFEDCGGYKGDNYNRVLIKID